MFNLALALPVILFSAPGKPAPVDFAREIQPVLKASCFQCHGPDKQAGGLRLDSRAVAFRGGAGGPAIVAGKGGESLLIRRLLATSGKPRMPLGFAPLAPAQIEKIRAWIDQGAPWVDSDPRQHWAYRKPVRPPLPSVKLAAWPLTPIDRFVLARLEKEGLHPSAPASREILIRRVYLDLIGLPPSPRDVDAFLADRRPGAYERVVDRLLASPQYGERWARPWLDLARYADSNGYEKDGRRSIWPYRDWVIHALNSDMPFDQFTIEQIAGDLLPNATDEQRIATGFHRNTMLNEEGGVDRDEQRWLTEVDRVGTTGSVWLGSTIACTQCHNHKYDPFSQKEFYQLLAFFDHTDEPALDVTTPEKAKQRADTLSRVAALETAAKTQTGADLEAAKKQIADLKKQLDATKPPSTLIMHELADGKEPSTYVRVKGAFLTKGESVPAGTPEVLNPFPPGRPLNRLGLAYWLVDRSNPLTARVAVNRIWEQYFGRGIVETSEDFGTQGTPPTHPELLDWLACEFMDKGWSLKKLHRLIVTSATYRQSSNVSPKLLERDPGNRLLARGPRFRLEAEMIRDVSLDAAGMLSPKMGGPSVFPLQPDGIWDIPYSGEKWVTSPGEDKYRRGIYTFWRRSAPYPEFSAFDATSREYCTVRRIRTDTPLQALTTLNDPAFFEAARGLARRMLKEGGSDPDSQVAYGFRLCATRVPGVPERVRLTNLYARELARFQADEPAARKTAGGPPTEPDIARTAALTVVANVLLNLDETLNKE